MTLRPAAPVAPIGNQHLSRGATASQITAGHTGQIAASQSASTTTGRLTAWLGASPWLTATELAVLTGTPARTVRHQLARLTGAGIVRSRLVEVAPWPRAGLHALARPDEPLGPAPLRLLRVEPLRALHAVLVRLARPGAAPSLVSRLRGEPGGPPEAGAPQPLAGLADGWLVDPAASAGLLVRWDDGDRHARVERAWLATLVDLAPVAPPTVIVCATPAALRRWRDRLDGADRLPPLRLAVAADLANAAGLPRRTIWIDEHGSPAPTPELAPLPPALLTAPAAPPLPRRLAALLAHRRALGAPDVLALRAVARQPLLTVPDLAARLDCSDRLAYLAVARLARRRLLRRLAPGEGTPGGRPAAAADRARPLWVTRAGLRLLAAIAGEPPARFRHSTPLTGGAVARPGHPNGSRTLGRLARHPAHTGDLIRLHGQFQAAVAGAQRAGRPIDLIDWQGPVAAPIPFPTDDPSLVRRRPAWARPAARSVAAAASGAWFGQVEPDAVARLHLDGRRLTLLIEWDRGTEHRARLARKFRHYVGWGDSPAATDAVALVITTTAAREALIHRLVATLAQAQGRPCPPLWTATIDAVTRQGPLAAIWWPAGEVGRRGVCHHDRGWCDMQVNHHDRPTTRLQGDAHDHSPVR